MDNRHEIVVKGNNNDGWSSDGMMLWLGRRQNEDMVESGSRGGYHVTVVQIP
jgi:hypothetical protein